MKLVMGGRGKISLLITDFITKVVSRFSAIPVCFRRIKFIHGPVICLFIFYMVENKEFRFGTKVGGVGNTRGIQIIESLICNIPGVFVISYTMNPVVGSGLMSMSL